MPETVATVAQLYLYPIKSMAGIAVQEAHVSLDGFLGDRLYAFVRANQAATNSFPWMTARESAQMLLYKPSFMQTPTPGQSEPAVEVRTPTGESRRADDPVLRDEIASQTGQSVFLLKSARGLFDCQHVSVFSLATLRALADEAGCAIDPRQFRANIYMQPVSDQAFEEDAWPGGLLQIGENVLIGVTKRDSRCMIVNLDPGSVKQDPRVLRAIAQKHEGKAGIYANVIRSGVVRVGDAIRRVGKSD
jgi:hypothetical protein